MVDSSRIARNSERAVVTAYQELKQAGTHDVTAFNACTTPYRIHHPEASVNESRRLVPEWLHHHIAMEKSGLTSVCACGPT